MLATRICLVTAWTRVRDLNLARSLALRSSPLCSNCGVANGVLNELLYS